METLKDLLNSIKDSFMLFFDGVVEYLPTLASALVLLVVGWILAKFIGKMVSKGLKTARFDTLAEKVGMDTLLNRLKYDKTASKLIGTLVYWVILLIFINATADVLGCDMVTKAIYAFFAYLPTLVVALVILVIGFFIAEKVKKVVHTATESIGISGAKAIGNIVYYLLMIIVVISALDQAGVDTTLITTHLTILFGGVLVAFAIAYGIGAKEIVGNILSSYYGKGKYKEGQVLRIGTLEGKVTQIDSMSFTLQTQDGAVVIPTSKLITEQITILAEPQNNEQSEED